MAAAAAPIALAATAGSAVLQGVASFREGHANAEAANYQAAVSRNMAQYAAMQGAAEESRKRMETSQLVGAQRAQMGANGFDVNSGSNARVQASSRAMGDLDALMIRSNARAKMASLFAQEDLFKMQASQAKQGAWLGLGGSILSGASSVAGKWSDMNATGVKPFGG